MKKFIAISLTGITFLLSACGPIHNAVNYQYKLESFSTKKKTGAHRKYTILVSQPDAIAGYQTEQMMYINKPFELSNFAHSAWISSPANMIYPLITQSLQHSGYFHAVASGADVDKADYRIDTQLIELQQNFLNHPSQVQLTANVVLTHIPDNRIVSSRLIQEKISCSEDTPYGGVIAANKATYLFTATLSNFVIQQIERDGRASLINSKSVKTPI